MQVMYKRCCGIDVHKMIIVCCLKKGNEQEIREFSAETKELIKKRIVLTNELLSKKLYDYFII